MAEQPSFVVDASVVVRWELRNAPYLAHARQVRDDYVDQRIALSAPDNLLVEVCGGIHHGMITRLLAPKQVEERIDELLGLELPTVQSVDLLVPAHRLARRFGCGFYDAIYLAVSDLTGYRFIHADRRLRDTLAHRFPLELWIEDYA